MPLYETVYDPQFMQELSRKARENLLKKKIKGELLEEARLINSNEDPAAEAVSPTEDSGGLLYKRASGKPLTLKQYQRVMKDPTFWGLEGPPPPYLPKERKPKQ